MANAAICGENFADAGGRVAGPQTLTMPVANLLDPHVERRWRAPTNDSHFVCDLLSSKALDLIVVRGLTAGANATVRVRVSTVDASGAVGDAFDSGAIADGDRSFDRRYGAAVLALNEVVIGRYVRVDLADPDASFVEAGRLFVGQMTAFTYNMAYGWSIGWVDRSAKQVTRGGQTLIWPDNKYRVLELPLKWVSAEQRYGVVETIDMRNGSHDDVVIVIDPASDNLARDTVLGLIDDVTPVVAPDAIFDGGGPLFSKQYKISERL